MRLFWVFLLLPNLVFAQSDEIQPWQVITALQADLTGDHRDERSILVNDFQPRDNLSLYIYGFGEPSWQYELKAYAVDAAWQPDGWGFKTTLTVNEDGNLEVLSINDSSTRFRGNLKLTIGYLDGEFMLVGYSTDNFDSRDFDASRRCSLNFLTGQGEMGFPQESRTTSFAHSLDPMPISGWPKDMIVAECERFE